MFCSIQLRALTQEVLINTLRSRQNGCHFADDILTYIFLNENVWIPIEISLKFVPKDPINNITALVQIMAWHRPGHKPLSEPVMVNLLTHICVTRPQWVNLIGRMCLEITFFKWLPHLPRPIELNLDVWEIQVQLILVVWSIEATYCLGISPTRHTGSISVKILPESNSHCGDKIVIRSSYLRNRIPCTGNTTS